MAKFESKFGLREIVKYKRNKIDTPLVIVEVVFNGDPCVRYWCRTETADVKIFSEWELEAYGDE